MPIAHLLELWKGIEVEPMETEAVVEDAALDEEPVKEAESVLVPGALQVSGFETGIEKLIFLPDRYEQGTRVTNAINIFETLAVYAFR
ncbi:hypothetical protein DUI87_10203 [Hirundo rustica rustica]|uniref:Uncharacterized protein n=1 Tax=Hirundo rustica rustica TaxID=333673 RepID=A0A3M0KHH0_HIRRU|nr:hypothetical protein DUI87_10203 [Hirundo rustica rustica]